MQVNRLETLDRLHRGKEIHREVMVESREKAQAQYVEYLEDALSAAREPNWRPEGTECDASDDMNSPEGMPPGMGFPSGMARMSISIATRIDHGKCFDHLILMFELAIGDTLELTVDEFGMLMHVLEMPEVEKQHRASMKGG